VRLRLVLVLLASRTLRLLAAAAELPVKEAGSLKRPQAADKVRTTPLAPRRRPVGRPRGRARGVHRGTSLLFGVPGPRRQAAFNADSAP
jgi:hypothetical protein